MKKKYPKLIFLLLTFLVGGFLFYETKTYPPFHDFLVSLELLGIFLGGVFYAYGFTSAPSTAVLLVLAKEQNIIAAGIIGGIGALLSDTFIFLFIRHTFMDEVEKLKKEKIIVNINGMIKKIFNPFDKYLIPVFASFLIASPLPTEMGVALMASYKNISVNKFVFLAFILHTIGILSILYIGTLI